MTSFRPLALRETYFPEKFRVPRARHELAASSQHPQRAQLGLHKLSKGH
jgi:hypothetical protein